MGKLRDSLDVKRVPLSLRPTIVIRQLTKLAEASRRKLMEEIYRFEINHPESFSDETKYFISNLVAMDATPELIHYLSELPFIERIESAESLRLEYRPPVRMEPSSNRSIGGHEPGLGVIKAPFMWKKGYSGLNRKVYIIDTGVWPEHPAIRRQWEGNYFPLYRCWKSFDLKVPGDKSESHGTHVAGICLGLEQNANDTIGVAFNASFIAADPIVQNPKDVKPIEKLIGAFEFALNPDGDTTTVDDVPDVVNNSWGITAKDSSLCSYSLIEDMFLALDAAGIAVEFSAGNEGPGYGSIDRPQYVTIDTLNIFTVGAVAATEDESNIIIADFQAEGQPHAPQQMKKTH